MNRALLFFILFTWGIHLVSGQTISGYVTDAETGEALIGATIINKGSNTGTVSNRFGFYSIAGPGKAEFTFRYLGYKPLSLQLYLQKDTIINITLQPGTELEEVVIESSLAPEQAAHALPMSTLQIPVEKINEIPPLFGEVDVLKVLQLLPGVQSGREGSAGLYVRGGGPDQNLILLDGIPVYNANHLFGFVSVFNADAINHVELVKGGFPARYGGRLSSIVDITMKEGNKQEYHGAGTVGFLTSKLMLEGPIKKNEHSFIVSARRSFLEIPNWILNLRDRGDEHDEGFVFYDLNAKTNFTLGKKHKLFVSFYSGKDSGFSNAEGLRKNADEELVKSLNEDNISWGNITGALRWNYLINSKLFSNTRLSYSQFRFNTLSQAIEQANGNQLYAYQYHSLIRDLAIRQDFHYFPSHQHAIRFGGQLMHHYFEPGVSAFENKVNDIQIQPANAGIPADEYFIYLEDEIQLHERMSVNAGLHTSGFIVRDEFYASMEPRLSANYLLTEKLSFKASYAKMRQYIHLLTNSGLGLPTDLWVPSTDHVKPQASHQLALGVASTHVKGFTLTLEGYYKAMEGLIEYEEGANYISNSKTWEEQVVSGSGKSKGIELLIQKHYGRLTGWIGYTLSKTTRQFDELNLGREFAYKYDRRHDISLTGQFKINERWRTNATWVYGTGNATSLAEGNALGLDYSRVILVYSERNNFRMADYHRLDLNITYAFQGRFMHHQVNVGAYNAYNRSNPYYLEVEYFSGKAEIYQQSLAPIIPYISYNFKF